MRSKFKWILTLSIAFLFQFSFAQEKTVTGVVSDAIGPLSGANVVVKGTNKGTTTNFDGGYTVKASQGDVLIFSYVGTQDFSLVVGEANTYNVTLKVVQLSEVVITGALGIKRKAEEVTSSYQVVQADEIKQAANPNIVQSLTAKVSGLTINTTSSGVSPTTRIVIRGNRSLSGDNQALVVIDNIISSANVLSSLPPSAIENVNVLKGSQGAALYGEQGVNGVIIVTTKKGNKTGKMSVSINNSVDFETIAFLPEKQTKYGQGWFDDEGFDSGDGNGDTTNIPWENGGWGPAFNDPRFAGQLRPVGLPQADGNFILSPWAPIEDNIKDFFKTGVVLQNGITLNVGGDDSYALLNINRQNTNFVVEGDKLIRNSFLFKAGKKFGKFSIDGNVNYITQSTEQTTPELYLELLQTASNVPVSQFAGGLNEHHWTVYYHSPFWRRNNERFNNKSDYVSGIAALGYEFNKNITANYTAGIRVNSANGQSFTNGFLGSYDYTDSFVNAGYTYYGDSNWGYADFGGSPVTSNYYSTQSSFRNFYADLVVNFDYDLSEDFNLKVNIGNNIQDNLFRVTSQGGSNLDIPGWYHINNVLSPDLPSTLDNRYVRSRKIAFFGNADLGYKDYLYLNATSRWENSSVIENSFFYPSVGLSFIPTKAFEIDNKVLNFAKLYVNWTKVGNSSAVNAYDTDSVGVIPTGFPFGNNSSFVFDQTLTAPQISPEFVATTEFGANLGFFNNRLTLDAAYYVQNTTDLITNVTTSSASGIRTLKANIGDLENKGFEIDLGGTPIKMENNGFRWDLRAGYSTNKTKITKLQDGANSVNLQTSANAAVGIFAEVGEQFPLIKGTVYERDENGNIIVNDEGVPLRSSDFRKLGKATPDYILNFSNTFAYKGIKLTVVADYRTGHQFYSDVRRNLSWAGHLVESAEFDREAGLIIPGVYQNGTPNTSQVYSDSHGGGYSGVLNYYSDIDSRTGESNVIDATAFKVRELALSYDLPSKLIEKAGIESLTLGVNARNPFRIFSDENKNYADPETANTSGNAQGIANVGRYPTTKTYGFSVNITF